MNKPLSINALVAIWQEAKRAEQSAVEQRREVEDLIAVQLEIGEALDGTRSVELADGATLKIIGRLTRTVDGDKAQEIAAEHGLQDHLSKLFRWKPEVNAAAWKATDAKITAPFADAITTKPGRPSFAVITKKEEET